MKRKGGVHKLAPDLPPELATILGEIEREKVPERLLDLARKLQQALAEKRSHEEKNLSRPGEARHPRQGGG